MNQNSMIAFMAIFSIAIGCKQTNKDVFICPPCNQSCDGQTFEESGTCPVCKMNLQLKGIYNTSLTRKQIEEDVDILISTLKSNHPGIYDYLGEKEFDSLAVAFGQDHLADMNILGEYKIVSKIVESVGDGHTYAMNPIDQNILQEQLLFPIIPEIINNQIFIENKELESINGHSIGELLETLQSFSNSDGSTLPYKNAFIEMEFPLRYFTFIDSSSTIDLRLKNGETKRLNGIS